MEAPDGTMARPKAPHSRRTSTSTVGLPRESSTSRARTPAMPVRLVIIKFRCDCDDCVRRRGRAPQPAAPELERCQYTTESAPRRYSHPLFLNADLAIALNCPDPKRRKSRRKRRPAGVMWYSMAPAAALARRPGGNRRPGSARRSAPPRCSPIRSNTPICSAEGYESIRTGDSRSQRKHP